MTDTTALQPHIATDERGYAVIHIPLEDVHGLRVALAPCTCRANKSIATKNMRERLRRGLGQVNYTPKGRRHGL